MVKAFLYLGLQKGSGGGGGREEEQLNNWCLSEVTFHFYICET